MTTHTTRIRAALGATLAAGLLLATPTAALAAPPMRDTLQGSFSEVIENFAGCGVTVLLEEEVEVKLLGFVGDDGSFEKEMARITGTITFTSEHGSFTDSYRYNGTVDPATGIAVERGVFNRGKGSSGLLEIAAGKRIVNLWNGTLLESVGVDTFTDGDFSSVCEELAG